MVGHFNKVARIDRNTMEGGLLNEELSSSQSITG
jgi:hypothetical protein